mgnify:CR=1 FL=1
MLAGNGVVTVVGGRKMREEQRGERGAAGEEYEGFRGMWQEARGRA